MDKILCTIKIDTFTVAKRRRVNKVRLLFSTKKLFPITKATSTIPQDCPKTVPLTPCQTSRVELEKVTQLEFWIVSKLAPYSAETQILPSSRALLFAQPQARTSSKVQGTVTTIGWTFFGFISRARSRDTIRKKDT